MNVFVLSTGRCGSMTFAHACGHINNFSSGHETKAETIRGRLDYPNNHIEVDNRLSWMLGSLNKIYPRSFYIHLIRDPLEVAKSYAKRFHVKGGIMPAFASGIIRQRRLPQTDSERLQFAMNYTQLVNDNIIEFLKDKEYYTISIHNPEVSFRKMWDRIGAQGSIDDALKEFNIYRNSGKR